MEMSKVLAVIALWVLLIIFAPVFTILALNTVFGLTIPVTFWTWLSVVWLNMATFGGLAASVKK